MQFHFVIYHHLLLASHSDWWTLLCHRLLSKNIIGQVGEVGRKPATFEDAARIATFILNCGYDFGKGKIIYNKFK